MLDADLWEQLKATDEATQRRVALTVTTLAMDAGPLTSGREQVEAALAAGAYGDSEFRQWLKDISKSVTAASLDAEELDHNRAEAKRCWRIARAYTTAYLALGDDPAQAAGEVTYEAMALVGEDQIANTVGKIISEPS
jgi:hypothetical protein